MEIVIIIFVPINVLHGNHIVWYCVFYSPFVVCLSNACGMCTLWRDLIP